MSGLPTSSMDQREFGRGELAVLHRQHDAVGRERRQDGAQGAGDRLRFDRLAADLGDGAQQPGADALRKRQLPEQVVGLKAAGAELQLDVPRLRLPDERIQLRFGQLVQGQIRSHLDDAHAEPRAPCRADRARSSAGPVWPRGRRT